MRIARALAAGFAVVLVCAGAAQAATPELSTTSRLQDRREVAAGQRSYVEGFQDGRFYANGWHITGEMGGVWAPPLKLVDGVWFGVDDQWVGPATKFSSGWGYTRYDLPDTGGLQRAAHRLRARRQPRRALRAAADQPGVGRQDRHGQGRRALRADGRLPVGLHRRDAQRQRQPRRPGRRSPARRSQFTDDGALPGAPEHHYAALVAANQDPASGEAAATGGDFRGPQPGDRLHRPSDGDLDAQRVRRRPVRQGHRRRAALPGDRPGRRLEDPVGRRRGLRQGPRRRAERAGRRARRIPAGALAAKVAVARQARRSGRRSRCPATGCCRTPSTGASRTSPTSRRPPRTCRSAGPTRASSSRRRWGRSPTRAGSAPATPTTRGSSPPTASTRTSPPWRSASSRSTKDHLRALRDISDVLNDRSGVVVHEAVSDGSIWFGHDSQTTAADGTKTNDFNTDETIKFPSAVALIWRWTGDNRFRDEMYDFAKRNLQYVVDQRLDVDHDGWPEGSGNVERAGHGPREARQRRLLHPRRSTTWPTWRAPSTTARTYAWATNLARKLAAASSRARGGTRPRSSTPTRWTTPATCSPSRSTGSARCRWRPS